MILLGLLLQKTYAQIDAAVQIDVIQSARDTSDRLTPQPPIHFHPPNSEVADGVTLTLNHTQIFQTIEGFGGAFTESSSHLFARLNETQQERLLDLYFDPAEGLGYTMGRYTMGSCDFALDYYNYASVKGDYDLAHFNFSHDDSEIVPFVQRAQARLKAGGKINLVVSPWSAPPWMKQNNHMNCDLGPMNCKLKTDTKTQEAWALYFSKVVDALRNRGLNAWGMTVQNEPEAQTGNIVYEGMHYTPALEKAFVRDHLGPRMHADHPDVNLLIYDHNKDHIVKWAQEILADHATAQYVWGTAFHWYTGPYFQNLEETHNLFPDFQLLSTEATAARQDPHTYGKPDWSKGEHYGVEIIGDLQHWSAGFIDWNLLLDDFGGPSHADPTGKLCEGGIKCGSDAMVIVNDSGDLEPQAFYFYMGQVSKFVPPGSRRIGLTNSSAAVTATAMLTPANETVVVVLNQNDLAVPVSLVDMDFGAANITVLPHSIVTLKYQRGS